MEPHQSTTKKRQRREVVSEEEYTSTLAQIIQRDYYADLPDLQLKVAVQNRREAQDFAGAVRVRRAARQLQGHEDALQETERQEEQGSIRTNPRPLHRETLSGFHSRVTSEDNAEFQQQQQEEVDANRKRLEEVFQPPPQQPLLLKEKEEEHDLLALASDEYNPPEPSHNSGTKDTPRNGLFFVPTPALPAPSTETGGGLLENSTNNSDISMNNDGALMPPPPSKSTPKTALIEYIPKTRLLKTIEPSQTRFPKTTLTVYQKPTTAPTTDDESSYATDVSTDLESEGRSLTEERQRKARRQHTTLVNMTPLVVPNSTIEASPLITWGAVAGTPLVVGGQAFTIPEEDSRAQRARSAAEQRSAMARPSSQKRAKKRDIAALSPAAQSLLAKTSNNNNPSQARSASSLRSALRSSYTPQRVFGSNSSRRREPSATPRRSATAFATTGKPPPARSITAGLLQEPSRK